MEIKRAKELLVLFDYTGSGCLGVGAKRPNIPDITKDELREVWSTGTKGTDTINSLLRKIIVGEI